MFPYLRSAIRKEVIVNTTTDKAFKGILYAKRGPLLILRNASLLDHGQTTAMDGDVLVERRNVDFVQVVG